MQGTEPAALETLARFGRGEATLDALAAALEEVEGLVVLSAPEEMSRYVHVFTDADLARSRAEARGLVGPDDVLAHRHVAAGRCAFECLSGDISGMVIDEGSEREVALDRGQVSRLYALLGLEDFAALPVLHLVVREGTPALARPDGDRAEAYVYTMERMAAVGVVALQGSFPGATISEWRTRELLAELLLAGVTRLVVDAGLPTARWYEAEELSRMLRHAGGPDLTATAAGTCTCGASSKATRGPSLLPVPPPGRDDAASRAALQDLRRSVVEETVTLWAYGERVAFDLDLYLPVAAERVEGLLWPRIAPHPFEEGARVVPAFSEERRAREAWGPDGYVHLSGIEAFRWAWACPAGIDALLVDAHEGSETMTPFPVAICLGFLYPQLLEIPDLEEVDGVDLTRIGALPGARGLKPEVVRALVRRWKSLLAARSADGEDPPLVEHAGRRYLPAFTGPDAFFDHASRCPVDLRPVPAGSEAPFGTWLAGAAELDGVLLDPASEAPLPLDHTDLLVLERWCREGARPRGIDVVSQATRLLEAGRIGPLVAARIAADWPRYYAGVRCSAEGVGLVTVPGRDCCAVFTDKHYAAFYLEACRQMGWIPGEVALEPVTHRWRSSVFDRAAGLFGEGVWIDPLPFDGDPAEGLAALQRAVGDEVRLPEPDEPVTRGLHLSGSMLEAALERIDEALAPRVPGFVG